jgi:phosphoadenosine phosphosulfate reductase
VRGLEAAIDMAVIAHPNLDRASAEEVLDYVVDRFHPRLYVACSFQKEASVIMDMILRVEPSTRFFTLDTDVLFEETYETKRKLEERFGIEVDVYRGMSLADQAAVHGPELWKSNPDACCGIRKVTPLKRALSDVDCWVAGLRREQADSRRFSSKLAFDERHALWKANPLADWSEAQVWAYIDKHDLPYNPLHDRGYPSIGCTHCTLPAGDGRAGRWADAEKTECGLHG